MSGIKINLEVRTDNYGKQYYIGKLKGPFVIDCNEKTTGGACFLIFLSEPGAEELQIAQIDNSQNKPKSQPPIVYKTVKKVPNE